VYSLCIEKRLSWRFF